MRKIKCDAAVYPEGKTHCLLLPFLFKLSVKFAVLSWPDKIPVGIKKPEIEAMLRAGYYVHVSPVPLSPNVFKITAVRDARNYSPEVQSLQDFRQVPRGYLPVYLNIDNGPNSEDSE